MATMQLQLQQTRLAPTTTKTEITQKQSLEVVQTFLHGSLSSLAYLRCFFSEKAFDEQTYTTGPRLPTYREYINGKLPKGEKNDGGMATVMKVLRRKRSKRADKFLDWLEKGAFVALEEGRLSALQIYVHTDPDHPEQVVETYTFAIKYHSDGRGGRVFAGIEVDSPGREGITIEATSIALQSLIRHVNQLCEGLPDLPEKRYVSMALFYPEDCKDVKAAGFAPSNLSKILFAQADGWEKTTERLDDVHSAYHSASLKVSHLVQPNLRGLAHIVEQPRIPSSLVYTIAGTRETELADMLGARPDDTVAKVPSTIGRTPSTVFADEGPMTGRTASTMVHDGAPDVLAAAKTSMATPAPTSALANRPLESESPSGFQPTPAQPSLLAKPILSESVDTQSSDVPEMKAGLQVMLKPEHLSQGDTQTQALLRPLVASSSNLGNRNVSAGPLANSSTGAKLVLLPDVARQLKSTKTKLKQKALRIAGVKTLKKTHGDVVLCQCSHAEEENELIQCSFCSTWQHLHCYGFTGSDDPRIPDEHACYECLLGDNDTGLLAALRDLALKRRAISFALQRGLPGRPEQLASLMDLSVETAGKLLGHLMEEGLVVHALDAKALKLGTAKQPHHVPTEDARSFDKLQYELFDALSHVSDYYVNVPSTPEGVAQRLRALCSSGMPPPTTPASAFRTRNRTRSERMLDPRKSTTPSRKPVQLRQPSSKRPLEGESPFTTPAKRQARTTPVYHRLKSVQTMVPIFADGLSSPAM
ncbi:hypothetical protein CB0940_08124 [Cercospora beticola]|uniref:HORMA domain-containing protein n=2 Tax=Cercospora beticola TaxID=122368 RepID=A0A2G5HPQ4_CERBT|nr:hypothetical protein CB0940_08124 [Cercospora beticola]PIA94498.1 hypothetical protein CB0940_08124 [Cercospora beticola]